MAAGIVIVPKPYAAPVPQRITVCDHQDGAGAPAMTPQRPRKPCANRPTGRTIFASFRQAAARDRGLLIAEGHRHRNAPQDRSRPAHPSFKESSS